MEQAARGSETAAAVMPDQRAAEVVVAHQADAVDFQPGIVDAAHARLPWQQGAAERNAALPACPGKIRVRGQPIALDAAGPCGDDPADDSSEKTVCLMHGTLLGMCGDRRAPLLLGLTGCTFEIIVRRMGRPVWVVERSPTP